VLGRVASANARRRQLRDRPFLRLLGELAARAKQNITVFAAAWSPPTTRRGDAMRAMAGSSAGLKDLRTDPHTWSSGMRRQQIGGTELRVVRRPWPKTTLTFTAKALSPTAASPHHVIGTGGAVVLIDARPLAATAGRASGDDYLIGRPRVDRVRAGSGLDFARSIGRRPPIEVGDAASAGRLEIEGFRPGTDVIVLTAASRLAAGRRRGSRRRLCGTILTNLRMCAPSASSGPAGSVLPGMFAPRADEPAPSAADSVHTTRPGAIDGRCRRRGLLTGGHGVATTS